MKCEARDVEKIWRDKEREISNYFEKLRFHSNKLRKKIK